MIMLQTIGVALAAKDTPIAQKARKMALEANGGEGGPTTLWGTGEKLASVNAALAAGTLADALDWEDCSWTGHPSAGIIPLRMAGCRGKAQERQGAADRYRGCLRSIPAHRHGRSAHG